MDTAEAEALRTRSRVMADVAARLRETLPRLSASGAHHDWSGAAQRAFDDVVEAQARRVRTLAASCDVASDALWGAAARLDLA